MALSEEDVEQKPKWILPRLFKRIHYTRWKVAFLPRAVWIGLAWKRYPQALDLMVCPLPCLGIGFYIQWHYRGLCNAFPSVAAGPKGGRP